MTSYYDEVEIEDMEFDEENLLFHWPCPCGDRFEISLTQLQEGEDVAKCPSCSLIRVIYDQVNDLRDEMLIGKDDLSEDARVETTDGNKLSTVEVGA